MGMSEKERKQIIEEYHRCELEKLNHRNCTATDPREPLLAEREITSSVVDSSWLNPGYYPDSMAKYGHGQAEFCKHGQNQLGGARRYGDGGDKSRADAGMKCRDKCDGCCPEEVQCRCLTEAQAHAGQSRDKAGRIAFGIMCQVFAFCLAPCILGCVACGVCGDCKPHLHNNDVQRYREPQQIQVQMSDLRGPPPAWNAHAAPPPAFRQLEPDIAGTPAGPPPAFRALAPQPVAPQPAYQYAPQPAPHFDHAHQQFRGNFMKPTDKCLPLCGIYCCPACCCITGLCSCIGGLTQDVDAYFVGCGALDS